MSADPIAQRKTEQDVATAALDKVISFLCSHIDPATVADALWTKSILQLLADHGADRTVALLRRCADSIDAAPKTVLH
jgi:hypothetical protein